VVTVADPAAGADWSTTVPASTEWEVLNVSARLTTSADVADRYPEFRVLASAVPLGVFAGTTPVTASKTFDYNLCPDQNLMNKFGYDGQIDVVPFAPRYCPPAAVIGARTFGLNANDQWSRIRLTVRARSV